MRFISFISIVVETIEQRLFSSSTTFLFYERAATLFTFASLIDKFIAT